MMLKDIFLLYTSICIAILFTHAIFNFPYTEIVGTAITIAWLIGLFVIIPIFLLLNNPYKHDVLEVGGDEE